MQGIRTGETTEWVGEETDPAERAYATLLARPSPVFHRKMLTERSMMSVKYIQNAIYIPTGAVEMPESQDSSAPALPEDARNHALRQGGPHHVGVSPAP